MGEGKTVLSASSNNSTKQPFNLKLLKYNTNYEALYLASNNLTQQSFNPSLSLWMNEGKSKWVNKRMNQWINA